MLTVGCRVKRGDELSLLSDLRSGFAHLQGQATVPCRAMSHGSGRPLQVSGLGQPRSRPPSEVAFRSIGGRISGGKNVPRRTGSPITLDADHRSNNCHMPLYDNFCLVGMRPKTQIKATQWS